jgi:predicted transcriptional regulator of viral defense system
MTATRLPDGSTHCRPIQTATAKAFDTDSDRLRDEFFSMPALCLTVAQVARLLNVPVVGATRLLTDLEHEGVLIRTPDGRYRLAEPLMC